MTFKECRKYGREEINKARRRYGYMYYDKNNGWYFSFIRNETHPPEYCLAKNGTVKKIATNKRR